MEYSIAGMCRGDGRSYIKVDLQGPIDTHTFSVQAFLANGKSIPCNLFALSTYHTTNCAGSFVVMIPQLETEQFSITIQALNIDGAMFDSISFDLPARQLKWQSRQAYVFNKQLAHEIRDIDLSVDARVHVDPLRCIRRDTGTTVHICYSTPTLWEDTYTIEFLDICGNPLTLDYTELSHACAVAGGKPGISMDTTTISIALGADNPTFCIWVHGINHPEHQGFLFMEDAFTNHLADEFARISANASSDGSYDAWMRARHLTADDQSMQRTEHFDDEPLISIVCPLFETPPAFFTDMIESVLAQTYEHWELVLVNASPYDEKLQQTIGAYNDKRIQIINLPSNEGIVANTNAGIAAATGVFIGFLDHDDVLEPSALHAYVAAINEHPDTDLLYCDEDHLENGRFTSPHFKSDFNRDLLYSHNYITHFLMVRASVLEQAGTSPAYVEGAQDYDLTLRVSEVARHIEHVSQVLYHWRVHEQSTSVNAESKNYALEAGRRALADHFERRGIAIERIDDGPAAFTYRPVYKVDSWPKVSIIIPSKDNHELLGACVDSIRDQATYPNYEIVIVENNSVEPETFAYYEQLQSDSRVRIVKFEGAFNFSKVVNFGVSQSTSEYVLLLNNDTRVITPDFLETMVGYGMRPEVGVVGAKLLHDDGTTQHGGVVVRAYRHPEHLFSMLPDEAPGYMCRAWLAQNVSAVTGACQLVRRSVFDQLGTYDEEYTVGLNDIDFCMRAIQAGYVVVYCPYAKLYHKEFASRGTDLTYEQRQRAELEYFRFHSTWNMYFLEGDPYYNPNFGPGDTHFAL